MTRVATPGLTIESNVNLTRRRLLTVQGEVLVSKGDRVFADQVVAQAKLPGVPHPLRAASMLDVPPDELVKAMQVKEGDTVKVGTVLAQTSSFFGIFANQVRSPIEGVVESISPSTGQIILRESQRPIEIPAYIPGIVTRVIPGAGVEIQGDISHVQGVFGLGGEVFGKIVHLQEQVSEEHKDCILFETGTLTLKTLQRIGQVGAVGVVAASASGLDMLEFAGGGLNPAATGDENLGVTVMLTEGFGNLVMADRARETLKKLEGSFVSLCGATQIRAGVIRPEVIASSTGEKNKRPQAESVQIGSKVRIIRGHLFGMVGKITSIPSEQKIIGSGAHCLVFEVEIERQGKFEIPRPNVELVY